MRPFLRASKLDQDDYDRAIAKGLNRVYDAKGTAGFLLARAALGRLSHHRAREWIKAFPSPRAPTPGN